MFWVQRTRQKGHHAAQLQISIINICLYPKRVLFFDHTVLFFFFLMVHFSCQASLYYLFFPFSYLSRSFAWDLFFYFYYFLVSLKKTINWFVSILSWEIGLLFSYKALVEAGVFFSFYSFILDSGPVL